MTSHTTDQFRSLLASLPQKVQRTARKAFQLWRVDPHHNSLQFKQVHDTEPIFSVRASLGYRALGVRRENDMIWYWIGSHAEYDKMLSK